MPLSVETDNDPNDCSTSLPPVPPRSREEVLNLSQLSGVEEQSIALPSTGFAVTTTAPSSSSKKKKKKRDKTTATNTTNTDGRDFKSSNTTRKQVKRAAKMERKSMDAAIDNAIRNYYSGTDDEVDKIISKSRSIDSGCDNIEKKKKKKRRKKKEDVENDSVSVCASKTTSISSLPSTSAKSIGEGGNDNTSEDGTNKTTRKKKKKKKTSKDITTNSATTSDNFNNIRTEETGNGNGLDDAIDPVAFDDKQRILLEKYSSSLPAVDGDGNNGRSNASASAGAVAVFPSSSRATNRRSRESSSGGERNEETEEVEEEVTRGAGGVHGNPEPFDGEPSSEFRVVPRPRSLSPPSYAAATVAPSAPSSPNPDIIIDAPSEYVQFTSGGTLSTTTSNARSSGGGARVTFASEPTTLAVATPATAIPRAISTQTSMERATTGSTINTGILSSSSASSPGLSAADAARLFSASAHRHHNDGEVLTTARAISSEDYEAEIRRRVEREAVLAIDVSPVVDEEENTMMTSKNNNRNNYDNNGNANDDGAENNKRLKWACVGAVITFLFVIIVALAVGIPLMRRLQPQPQHDQDQSPPLLPSDIDDDVLFNDDDANLIPVSDLPAPNDHVVFNDDDANLIPVADLPAPNDPNGNDNLAGDDLVFQKMLSFEIKDSLPSSTSLQDILDDRSSPQYKALTYLVVNRRYLFSSEYAYDSWTKRRFDPSDKSKAITLFALVTMYHAMGGDFWYTNRNWLDPKTDLCDWSGVRCKKEGVDYSYYDIQKSKESAQVEPKGANEGKRRRRNLLIEKDNGAKKKQLRSRNLQKTGDELIDNHNQVSTDNTDDDDFYDNDNERVQDVNVYDEKYKNDLSYNVIHIQSIVLKANNLIGTIPDEIGMLTNVYQMIDLATNNIEGSIPSLLSTLSNLQGFDVSYNRLSSTIPTDLGQLLFMRKFDISGNTEIVGSFPAGLEKWEQIEQLDIAMTGLTGSVPSSFCYMLRNRLRDSTFEFTTDTDRTVFQASCPDPFACACCTKCCHSTSNDGIECERPPAPAI